MKVLVVRGGREIVPGDIVCLSEQATIEIRSPVADYSGRGVYRTGRSSLDMCI